MDFEEKYLLTDFVCFVFFTTELWEVKLTLYDEMSMVPPKDFNSHPWKFQILIIKPFGFFLVFYKNTNL